MNPLNCLVLLKKTMSRFSIVSSVVANCKQNSLLLADDIMQDVQGKTQNKLTKMCYFHHCVCHYWKLQYCEKKSIPDITSNVLSHSRVAADTPAQTRQKNERK